MYPTEKFDLIVKMERKKNQEKYSEINYLEQIEQELKNHDPLYYIKESEFYNIYMVELGNDKLKTAIKLAKASLNNTYEMVPIESVVISNSKKIVEEIANISKYKIKSGETFTIKCNVRGKRYINSREDLIKFIHQELEKLNGKPDKNNPDWVIHIEVLGENTGISILKPR